MTRAALAEARAFQSWHDYQAALKRAIAPLTEAQMQRRLLPGLRTPGEIAEHIVFGRALHLHRTLGERAAELTPLRSSTTGFSRRTKRLVYWLTLSRFASLRSPVTVTTVASCRLHARIWAPSHSNAGLPYMCSLPSIADL